MDGGKVHAHMAAVHLPLAVLVPVQVVQPAGLLPLPADVPPLRHGDVGQPDRPGAPVENLP